MNGSVWGLFVAAVVCAGVCDAHPLVRHRAVHHRSATTRTHRRGVAIATVAAPPARPYDSALSARSDAPMPTSLRYRFGHGRMIGAVGYNRVTDGYEIDPHEVNSAAGIQLGHPDATVGARIRVPF